MLSKKLVTKCVNSFNYLQINSRCLKNNYTQSILRHWAGMYPVVGSCSNQILQNTPFRLEHKKLGTLLSMADHPLLVYCCVLVHTHLLTDSHFHRTLKDNASPLERK